MVLNWVNNSALKKTEVLINVLYDLGMAEIKHIEAATGWNYSQTKKVIYRVRKDLKKQGENEQDWIKTTRKSFNDPMVYYLSMKFIYQVEQMREDRTIRSSRGLAQFQRSHYIGINNIFYNAVQHYGRDQIEWYSEYESTELIALELGEKRAKVLRPDAKMRVGEKALFIEFDNSTVGPQKLDLKFKRYIDYVKKTGDSTPVLWVTLTEARRKYLERNWKASIEGNVGYLPRAYFCIADEEGKVFTEYFSI